RAPGRVGVASMMWMVAGEELGVAAGTVTAGALAQQAGAWPALFLAAAPADRPAPSCANDRRRNWPSRASGPV
ncbi:hypothetical protein ABZ554_48200, partial [Streptomyces sp. NPDC020125]